MTYEAIRCQCGHRACKKWEVSGIAAEAKFEERQAVAVALLLNALDAPNPRRQRAKADLVGILVEAARPILAGREPDIQGATLCDLLAIWLAGHPEELRDDLLGMHVEKTRELAIVNAKIIREGLPP